MWGKTNRVCFVLFCVSKHISAQLYTAVWEPVHQCQDIYYSHAQTQMVRCPPVFREMKCNLVLNMEEDLHFLLRRVYILCVRKYFQDETNCNLLCWRILNISSLLNGI